MPENSGCGNRRWAGEHFVEESQLLRRCRLPRGFNKTQPGLRAAGQGLDLAGEMRLGLASGGNVPRGQYAAFKIKGRRLEPIKIGLEHLAGSAPVEMIAKGAGGLLSAIFGAAGFVYPHLQLSAWVRRQQRPGAVEHGIAADSRQANDRQQRQTSASAAPRSGASGGLTDRGTPG
jgi:hypothetical protein